jgi:hypothetical protein
MTNARAWPVRAMYILIAAALAIGLFVTAAPAQNVSAQTEEVKAEWEMTDTPTIAGWVLAPESVIYDYALASEGTVAYAVVQAYDDTCVDNEFADYGYRLLKSVNGAATWADLTGNLEKVLDITDDDEVNDDYIEEILQVATDWIDPSFVAVALVYYDYSEDSYVLSVFFSTDGGDTFVATDEVADEDVYLEYVSDLVVSLPVSSDVRDIAIGGQDDSGNAVIFRSTVTVSSETASEWENTTVEYDGWVDSEWVTDLIFSPNWPTDRTILAVTYGPGANFYDVYLQSGSWGKTTASSTWNQPVSAVLVKNDVALPTFIAGMFNARGIAGVALPDNYDGTITAQRWAFVWVNYYNDATPPATVGEIVVVKNNIAAPQNNGQIPGTPWLTNVSYLGTISEGSLMAGVLGAGTYNTGTGSPFDLFAPCCEGVAVWRYTSVENMNLCCPEWELACKLPSGRAAMAVSYVDANNAGDTKSDKAYAVALYGIPQIDDGADYVPYDESAWSVSVGDTDNPVGRVWNQLSLVDTWIDYISDVAVSPDCNKMMLATVHLDEYAGDVYLPELPPYVCYRVVTDLGDDYADVLYSNCDSVWLKASDNLPEDEEYTGYWIRTWFGILEGQNDEDFPFVYERSLLRLPPASVETTGDTVYLIDRGTGKVYYNDLETWNCWTPGTSSIDEIADVAVLNKATIYALGEDGYVAMSDENGKGVSWTDPVDSGLDAGWTIAVFGSNATATDVIVGGQDGDVSYSNDFDSTDNSFSFTALDDVYTGTDVHVTVAFDTYFATNDVIYAALANAGDGNNGIFSTTIPDGTEWTDLGADPDFNYTGLVLSYLGGNPFTSADTGGVLYASYFTWISNDDSCAWDESMDDYICYESGVARSLTPIMQQAVCPTCASGEWDYLKVGLSYTYGGCFEEEATEYAKFVMPPQALKVCGCMDPNSDTHLFAIDGPINGDQFEYYDMVAGQEGTVWTFEDCYAKKQVVSLETPSPIGTSACECCNAPFTMKWDRLCDACCYDIEFAMDEAFTEPYTPTDSDGDQLYFTDSYGDSMYFDFYCPAGVMGATGASALNPSAFITCGFQPETTYYWRVRTVQAATGQVIHSWWSEAQSFTVAPTSAAGTINLVSPVPGATNIATTNIPFSWSIQAHADSFNFVLSPNADLSSAILTRTGLTKTAVQYTGTALSYDTPYYWQVTAYSDGTVISTSDISTFRTAVQGSFCSAIDGQCFPTQAELAAHNAALEKPAGTPFWVWVVIGIGAVLVIVVIVLIFRTRRV